MEDDLILNDGEEEVVEGETDGEIIQMQLVVINSVLDVDPSLYDTFEEDRVKVIANAMRIIQKIQRKIIKELP